MTGKQSIYTLASIYIGTVIGAGFASGQEIFHFFGRHGYRGILGIAMTTVLFSLLGVLSLSIIYEGKIRSFEQFVAVYFNKTFFKVINAVLIFLLFIIYVVMLSGSGAVLYEHFKIPHIYGILIMAGVTLYVFISGIEGIARANNIVVPFLILVILWMGIWTIYKNKAVFSNFHTFPYKNANLLGLDNKARFLAIHLINKISWLWSAFLYVAFNSISTIVVMSSLGPLIKDKRAAVLGGILGGFILGVLALVILINLLTLHTSLIGIEVPMIAIAGNLGRLWKQIYSLILLVAMFTTAIANGYGSILGISSLTRTRVKSTSIVICIISVPLAMSGFKRLVTLFYPLFGYIGVVFILAMALKARKI